MKKDLNNILDKFLQKSKDKTTNRPYPKQDYLVKDGLFERIDEKTFLIEDGRQLLND